MRTLILSCSIGEGHNSCAKAIKEVYDLNNEYCIIKDVLGFISDKTAEFFSKGHTFLYRHIPCIFKYGYSYAEKHPELFYKGTVIYKFFIRAVDKLYEYINENKINSVICTHVFSGLIITALKDKYSLSLKTCFVATDYTCSPVTRESRLDLYFVPDEIIAEDYIKAAVPHSKIIASGIPVHQAFYQYYEKDIAKVQLNIPNCRHLVVMGGSMGCGNIELLVKKLTGYVNKDWYISIICGTNSKLRKKLEKQYAGVRNIKVYGYVNNIPLVLDSADFMLTKPGGISTTEAAVKKVPMVFVNAVAGCEKYNSSYFAGMGCAKASETDKNTIYACLSVMEDTMILKHMKLQYSKFQRRNSAYIIFENMISNSDTIRNLSRDFKADI